MTPPDSGGTGSSSMCPAPGTKESLDHVGPLGRKNASSVQPAAGAFSVGGRSPLEECKPRVVSARPQYELFGEWGLYRTNLREYHSSDAIGADPPQRAAGVMVDSVDELIAKLREDGKL